MDDPTNLDYKSGVEVLGKDVERARRSWIGIHLLVYTSVVFDSPSSVDRPRCDQNAGDDSCKTGEDVKMRLEVYSSDPTDLHVRYRVLDNREHRDSKQPKLKEDEGDILSSCVVHATHDVQKVS